MRLLTLLLLASLSAAAQEAPLPLDNQQADLWHHTLGHRESIHTDTNEPDASPFEIFRSVTLRVTVSATGHVDAAHATAGPKQLYDQAERIELTRTFKPFLHQGTSHAVQIMDYVAILPPERWREPHIPFPLQVDQTSAAIALERTGCFGSCPSYQVTVSGDGTVRFRGGHFVLIPGQHTARIPQSAVRNLIDAFRRADFLSALPEYRAEVTDMPTQALTLTLNGVPHTVVDYAGPEVGLPDAIHDLERQVDEAAGTERWIEGNDLTLPSLKAEAWPFSSSSRDNIALYDSAIARHDEPLMEAMLQAKAPPATLIPATDRSSVIEPPLCVASAFGNSELVDRMIETTRLQGKLPAYAQSVLDACLAASATNGSLPLVELWLGRGADPLATHPGLYGQPASILAHAIDSGNPAVVARILRFKVNLAEQVGGRTPLLLYAADPARRVAHPDSEDLPAIIALLVRAGADIEARDDNGRTAVFCNFCTPATIAALVAARARVDARDPQGRTPLIASAYDLTHVEAFLTAGADPAAAAGNGATPLSTARQSNCAPCVEAIEAAIKKLNPTDPTD